MIVVDTNVLAYLLIPGSNTANAESLLQMDSRWIAPPLWRSELRNVLATYVRSNRMQIPDAEALFRLALAIVESQEDQPDTGHILRLSGISGCSAYDCEYVALAERLQLALVTADMRLARSFPATVTLLSNAVNSPLP